VDVEFPFAYSLVCVAGATGAAYVTGAVVEA